MEIHKRIFLGKRMAPLLCAASLLLLAGCHSSGANRYKLEGRVLSVDKSANTMEVDCREIPGKMSAMMMSFEIPDSGTAEQLGPGDEISADLVVPREEGGGSHLENIVVTRKARATAPSDTTPAGVTPPTSQSPHP